MRKSVKTRKIRGGTWLALAVMFLFCLLSGCGRAESGEEPGDGEGGRKLKVAATLFPYYDFVRQVAGDQVELSLVIPAGMDSHSFEPTPRDIRTMQEADVIIANGGAMEHWVDQVVDSFDREDQTVVIMMDHVDAVEEEIVEGMEHSDEGHRLVSDDVVEIRKVSDETLVGSAPDITKYFIELRGIGIIDVKTLFGVESVKDTQSINMVIRLEEWDKSKEYDRLGMEDQYTEFLGNKVICHDIPIRPGRNLAVIVESAAVNYRQKKMGYNAAKELYNRVQANLARKS